MLSEADIPQLVANLVDSYACSPVTEDSVWCPIAIDSWTKILDIARAINEQNTQTKPQIEHKAARSKFESASNREQTEYFDHDMDEANSGSPIQWRGPIDNSSLCEPGLTTMSRELVPNTYELVPENVFNRLVEIFGIIPVSAKDCSSFRCRTRLNPEKMYEVEVTLTPLYYHLGYNDKTGNKGLFSRFDTLTDIYKHLVALKDSPKAKNHNTLPAIDKFKIYRLTDPKSEDWIEQQKEKSLVSIGLGPNSVICFDIDRSLENLLERSLSTKDHSPGLYLANKKRFNSASDEKHSSCSSSSSSSSSRDSDGSPVRGLCGLVNLGNTCFMNSSIQCLSNVQHMRQYFESDSFKQDVEAGSEIAPSTFSPFRSYTRGLVANAFSNLMKEMWKPGATYCDPSALKHAISRISNKFSGYSQQDSQELMGVLLDALHEDVKRQWKDLDCMVVNDDDEKLESGTRSRKQLANLIRQRLEKMSQDIKCPDNDIAKLALNLHRCQGESYVMRLFQGMVKSTVQCLNCYHYSRTFDPFMFLCLPISEDTPHFNSFSASKRSNFKHSAVQRKPAMSVNTKAVFCPLITINGVIRIVVVCLDRTMFVNSDKGGGGGAATVDTLTRTAEESCVFVDTGGVHAVPRLYLVTDNHEKSECFTIVDRDEPLSQFLRNRCNNAADDDHNSSSTDSINLNESKFAEYTLQRGLFLCQCPPYIDDYPALITITTGRLRLFPLFVSCSAVKRSVQYHNKNDVSSILILANQTLKSLDFDVRLCPANNNMIETTSGRLSNDPAVIKVKSYIVRCKLANSSSSPCAGYNDVDDDCTGSQVERKKAFHKRFRVTIKNRLLDAKLPHLGDSSHSVTLNQCLSLFTETELLDEEDMWFCSECKRKSISTKRMDIFQLPPYLLIQLKRFRQMFYGRQKIDTQVEFPIDRLDLRSFLPRTNQRQSCLYDLVAISNHYGSLHSGHYTACARNCMDNKWHMFDDRHVSKIKDNDQLITNHAYILVYKSRDCAP